jgi:hypothetical protein
MTGHAASPGDVEVHATPYVVDQGFLRARAPAPDAVVPGDPQGVFEHLWAAREVRRAALEVVRVADATHSPIPLARATARGDDEARALGQE